MSDLTPEQIEELNRVGWKCDDFSNMCGVNEHAGKTHKLIYDPVNPSVDLTIEFEGNAVVLHIGELGGDFKTEDDLVVFPPGKFVFCLTNEAMNLPFDINGTLFQNPRISNLGLLFFTLGHVDAGFSGHLTCTFLNTTEKPIKLKRREGVLYLVLTRTEKAHYPRFAKDFHREPQIGITVAQRNVNFRPAFILTKENVVTRNELYKWLGVFAVAIASTVSITLAFLQILVSKPATTPPAPPPVANMTSTMITAVLKLVGILTALH